MATSFSGSSESALLHASLTWTIDNFSRRNTMVVSPAFSDEKKNTFDLRLYPDVKGFVALDVNMFATEPVEIRCKINLICNHGRKHLLYDDTETLHILDKRYNLVGLSIPMLMSCSVLHEPSALGHYLPNDTMALHCQIEHRDKEKTVTLGAIPCQADTTKSGNAEVRLLVGGKTLLVNKSMLSVRSPVFAAMFSHDTKENVENQVEIPDITVETMKKFVEYLYTGTMPTLENIKSAEELFIAADRYGAGQLMTVCEEYLISQMTAKTAPSFLRFVSSVNSPKLEDAIRSYLYDAFKDNPEKLDNLYQKLSEMGASKSKENSEGGK